MRLALWLVLIGACGGGPSIPGPGDDDIPPPDGGPGPDGTGVITFNWQLSVDGTLAECFEVGAVEVELLSMNVATSEEFLRRFGCAPTGNGTSNPLPPGTYSNLISLLDSSALAIQTQSNAQTVSDGGVSNAGLIIFNL